MYEIRARQDARPGPTRPDYYAAKVEIYRDDPEEENNRGCASAMEIHHSVFRLEREVQITMSEIQFDKEKGNTL